MCGIAGHVASVDAGRGPQDARALVREMADALHHRGPDASGVHQSGLATLGHTRLSIIDLSTGANQPMLSADGQVVTVRVASYAEGVPRVPTDVNMAQLFPWSRQRLLDERATETVKVWLPSRRHAPFTS